MAREPEGLIPVDISSKYTVIPNTVNKLKREDYLIASNGKQLTGNLDIAWLQYMKEILNRGGEKNNFDRNGITISDGIIAKIVLHGMPVEKKEGKSISRDDLGNYYISMSKEYSDRIKELKKRMPEYRKIIPKTIDVPVHIRCVFFLNRRNIRISLSDMVASTIDMLVRLKLLKSANNSIVCRTDGSEVKYILGEPHTVVYIAKMREEFVDV